MSRISAYARWLWPAVKVLVVWIGMPLIVPLTVGRLDWATRFVQLYGLALQLLGFSTVALEIRGALKQHDRPSIPAQFRDWWRSRPGARRMLAMTGIASAGATGRARGRVRSRTGIGGPEERLAALERNQAAIDGEIDELWREHSDGIQDLATKLKAEMNERSAEDSRLAKKVEQQAVGGADRQLLALLWFASGAICSTIPDLVVKCASWL